MPAASVLTDPTVLISGRLISFSHFPPVSLNDLHHQVTELSKSEDRSACDTSHTGNGTTLRQLDRNSPSNVRNVAEILISM